SYKAKFPELAAQTVQIQKRQLPDGWEKTIPVFPADKKGMAGRESSGKVLNAVAKAIPWLIGGSAALAPTTKTRLTFDGAGDFGYPRGEVTTGGGHGAKVEKTTVNYAGG